jgi:ABC-type uncharacterized transport system substrate-binding protein
MRQFTSDSRHRLVRRVLSAALLACFVHAPEADAKILIVKSDDLPQYEAPIRAFTAAVDDAVEVIDIKGSRERGQTLLERAAKAGDVQGIFALGTQAAYLSKTVMPAVPMSFAMVLNWERYEFAQPTTGVAVEIPVDVLFTRFRLLLPSAKRIGLIYSERVSEQTIESARRAAVTLGMRLIEEKVRYSDDVPGAYRRIRSAIDALWMPTDPVVVTRDNFRYLSQRCEKDGNAFLAFSENFVRAGALLSISPDYGTMGSQAALLLERSIENPASPPAVQPPLGSSLVINALVAEEIGIDLNAGVLGMADVVVESR